MYRFPDSKQLLSIMTMRIVGEISRWNCRIEPRHSRNFLVGLIDLKVAEVDKYHDPEGKGKTIVWKVG